MIGWERHMRKIYADLTRRTSQMGKTKSSHRNKAGEKAAGAAHDDARYGGSRADAPPPRPGPAPPRAGRRAYSRAYGWPAVPGPSRPTAEPARGRAFTSVTIRVFVRATVSK